MRNAHEERNRGNNLSKGRIGVWGDKRGEDRYREGKASMMKFCYLNLKLLRSRGIVSRYFFLIP